ncbi:WD40-repeat-containing domain protein [Paraphysoderma sedebokerense]|nr:WD40-repeat-containing domain protein [Paraphysoderma sedebokerense]
MAPITNSKLKLKTSFKAVKTLKPIYTGGKASITHDGKYLISSIGEDINVMEIESGNDVHRLKGDTEVVTCFAVKPNGTQLCSASRSLLLTLWDLTTGQVVRQWKAHEAPVIVMDFDHTSTLVATGSADSTIKVWDTDKGFCTHNLKGHRGVISAVKFHMKDQQWKLFSGSDDCTVRIWDLMTRKCIAVLENHVSVVRGLDISSDGSTLLSAARDKVVSVWDTKSKKLIKTIPAYESLEAVGYLETSAQIPGVQETALDKYYFTGGEKGMIRVWNIETQDCVFEKHEVNIKHQLLDVVYNKTANRLVGVTSDQNFLFYDVSNDFKRSKQIIGYNDEIIDLTYIGENSSHIAVATNSEQIRIFNTQTSECDIVHGHKDIVFCLDNSNDGTMMVSGSKDHTARIWSLDLGSEISEERCKCIGVLVGHAEAIGAISISRKSKLFVITGSQDRTIKCWDISSLNGDVTEPAKPKSMYTVRAHDKDINSIAIAPNDKIFATGSQDKTAKVWSAADGALLGVCKGHKRGVWDVQFSPVDQVLATCSGDKTIRIWSISDYSCLKTFEGHTNSVLKVSFLTSGTQLLSTGSDGLAKLWTIKTNECVTTLDNHEDKAWALAVRNDEHVVATGGADSVINFWEDYTLIEEEEKIKEEEDRILKEQDLSNFLLKRDYRNAILLAMSLNQPRRLLRIFSDVMKAKTDEDSITGSKAVDSVLGSFDLADIKTLLEYIRDWNTNSRNTIVAQTVLRCIFESYSPDALLKISGIKELVDGLIPYTERHFARAEDMITKSYIVDYTLQAMDIFNPIVESLGNLDLMDNSDSEEDDSFGARMNGLENGKVNGKRKRTENGDVLV